MTWIDIIITMILILVLGGAIFYIVRAKKRGQKCIGCPESTCPSRNGGGCSCCNGSDTK